MKQRHEWIDAQGKWSVYESPTGFYMRPHGAKVPMPAGKEILRLSAEVDRLKALTEWQEMDTAPDDGTRIHVVLGFETFVPDPDDPGISVMKEIYTVDIAYWTEFNGGGWVTNLIGIPKLWSPLPELPKEAE